MSETQETRLLRQWYGIVQNETDEVDAWADAVMSDPENGIVFTRLANCAGRTVEMMLKLAERDQSPETVRHVEEAMRSALRRSSE
jgi:hypothetical protein